MDAARAALARENAALKAELAVALAKGSEDAALIEFVRFNPFAFDTSASPTEKQWAPARYVAFVLIGGSGRRAEMLDLGESADNAAMLGCVPIADLSCVYQPKRSKRPQSLCP